MTPSEMVGLAAFLRALMSPSRNNLLNNFMLFGPGLLTVASLNKTVLVLFLTSREEEGSSLVSL